MAPIILLRHTMFKIVATFKSVIRYFIILITHKPFMRIMLAIHSAKLIWRKHSLKKKNPGRKFVAIDLTEHFGDIVACEPVSRYIRQQYPDAHILWSVRKPYRQLIDSNPNIDETLVVYCLTEWILLPKEYLFDETIELHFNGRVCPDCKVPLINLSGNNKITAENYYNFGGILSAFCQVAGLPTIDEQPAVYISQPTVNVIDSMKLPDTYIVVHCTSNELARDWTPSKWINLSERLINDFRLHIIEVGTKSMLKGFRPDYYTDLCNKLSLLETAEVIKRSWLFIGVDSGPAQLANAVNTYGIILIGHYRDFKNYLPYSGKYGSPMNATILYEDGPASDIKVDRVYEEIVKLVELRSDHEAVNNLKQI